MTTQQALAENTILRTARKEHRCIGSGGGPTVRRFAPGHTPLIQPGERYGEYVGETPAYHAGSATAWPAWMPSTGVGDQPAEGGQP